MASDETLREGVRQNLAAWIKKLECGGDVVKQQEFKNRFIDRLKQFQVLAIETDAANEQHYEVPTDFFLQCLGPRMKYSACDWPQGVDDLAAAEDASLALICERAGLEDGMKVMDLGCGWGSLTLYIAEKFPRCSVTCVSNSNTQRQLIQSRAAARDWSSRVTCITADANTFDTADRFHRIISIEMFEHLKNYQELFRRVSTWLLPDGKLFTQVLCHREFPYNFETRGAKGATEWMAKHFFSGGTMPSADLFLYFQRDLEVERLWRVNGKHYARTLEAWLSLLDQRLPAVKEVLRTHYPDDWEQQLFNWRLFFMFCAEVFGYDDGNEWLVAHHLFSKRSGVRSSL